MRYIVWCLMGLLARSSAAVEVGGKAPRFEALNQDGKEWRLADHLGGKPVVVYFYPAAMTGGCTKQACAYRDHLSKGAAEFTVVGISGDAPAGLRHFRAAEQINFDLLSDPDGAVAKAFGVPVKRGERSITREVEGEEVELKRSATAARWTFVVGADGTVVYKAASVKPTEDLAHVLDFLKP